MELILGATSMYSEQRDQQGMTVCRWLGRARKSGGEAPITRAVNTTVMDIFGFAQNAVCLVLVNSERIRERSRNP